MGWPSLRRQHSHPGPFCHHCPHLARGSPLGPHWAPSTPQQLPVRAKGPVLQSEAQGSPCPADTRVAQATWAPVRSQGPSRGRGGGGAPSQHCLLSFRSSIGRTAI